MEQALVVAAVWFVVNQVVIWITSPKWFPALLTLVLGIGGQLLIEPGDWWLGIGLAGAASLLILVGDLLLVTTDAIRSAVFLKLRRRE